MFAESAWLIRGYFSQAFGVSFSLTSLPIPVSDSLAAFKNSDQFTDPGNVYGSLLQISVESFLNSVAGSF